MKRNLTDGERQFIEIVSERQPADDLKITIELAGGGGKCQCQSILKAAVAQFEERVELSARRGKALIR